jgi:FkbM family methyltransferase
MRHFEQQGQEMLSRTKNRVLNRLARRRYSPDIEVDSPPDLLRLGSSYGGWTFEPSSDLQRSKVLSCGLGEDASFDVEFASAFNATVIIVDPTPRAIAHFAEMQARVGQPAVSQYLKGGKQPATAYDLRMVAANTLVLEPSALWIEDTRLRFYAPQNPDHVSHSIVNLQGSASQSARYIEVPAIALETLIEKYGLTTLPLMKLDIEGAEVKVIRDALERRIFPRQLLVEFDEMNFPSDQSKKNAEDTDGILRQAGYACRYFDGVSNFLYTRR